MKDQIKKLVIVGGGTAGWMAAASLATHFKGSGLSITVVDSSKINTVGVGEATIPTFRSFYQALGLSDAEVVRETQATAKLAIRFEGWSDSKSQFFHPFGLTGQDVRGIGFQHFWEKMSKLSDIGDLQSYSLASSLANANKMSFPSPTPSSALSVFDWALHIDANRFAGLMKKTALARGVTHIDGIVSSVFSRAEDGFIHALQLDSGLKIDGELFIDCTGFSALLIEGELKTGYESWSDYLFCDSAVALQTALSNSVNKPPYTRAIARDCGWQWSIPLQNRQGNGLVFSSAYASKDRALEIIESNTPEHKLSEARFFSFDPGRRKKAWNKNCIALGLSAGFIEPLESTSIALIETGIEKIKRLFPHADICPYVVDEFNEMTALEYERVRDFIVLHYTLNGRKGEPFWDHCRQAAVPDSLKEKMDLFYSRGHLKKRPWEIFQGASWLALYNGLGYSSRSYDLAVDTFDEQYLTQAFAKMRSAISASVAACPSHDEFIDSLVRDQQRLTG